MRKKLLKVGDIVTFPKGYGFEINPKDLDVTGKLVGSSDLFLVTGIIKIAKELVEKTKQHQIVQLVEICEDIGNKVHIYNECTKCNNTKKILVSDCDLEIKII
ncbi:MAG: hypothetical protein UT05_C0012G0015 [Parcubacteria group bacterium GW2011_GWF2_38_76]|nr:MAG: hypothetical protein UT05_C0012G0015 [Parcubacteria group bacterium GW2011_GWF2_38_76]HBM46065.1 hypothetical protein [Patescibacteria group bacterium]